MKKILFDCLLFAISCFSQSTAYAQDYIPPGLKSNGCGAAKGWSSKLVPNNALLGHCEFKASCDAHDICYGRCLEGGSLFGKPECNDAPGSVGKKKRQMECDARLGVEIIAGNKGKRVCSFYASLYQWAVEHYGQSSFSGIGEGDPVFKVIREFLNYAEKNPSKYSDADQDLLLNKINGIDNAPNQIFGAEFDKFSGKFALWQIVDDRKFLIVKLPQKVGN